MGGPSILGLSPAATPPPAQPFGSLLYPPPQNPVSTLTVPPPVGSQPYVPEQSSAAATAVSAPDNAAAEPVATPSTTKNTANNDGTTTTGLAATTVTQGAPAMTTDIGTDAAAANGSPTTAAAISGSETQSSISTGAATGGQAQQAATGTAADTGSTVSTAATSGQVIEATPAPTQVDGQLRIAFPMGSAGLSDTARSELDGLVQKMTADQNMRIELTAYATGTPETATEARRMSLSRALTVRSYLIKQGVSRTRMDVRALGNNVQNGPPDRVDILPKT